MFANLSQREKVMIFILFTLSLIFFLYKFIWVKQSDIYKQAKAEYENLNVKVSEYRNSVNTLAKLKKEQTELKNRLETVNQPFKIDIMGGEQIREIGRIIENAGLKVQTVAPISTVDDKVYYEQQLKFRIVGSYGALEQFFYDTEYSKYAFRISKFDIKPNIPADTDPLLAGLHYSNLIADLIITVIGDKTSKVDEPELQTFKVDLFKPAEEDMKAMQEIAQTKEEEKISAEKKQNITPSLESFPASSIEETTAKNESLSDNKLPNQVQQPPQELTKEYKVLQKPKEHYKINYSFQKK